MHNDFIKFLCIKNNKQYIPIYINKFPTQETRVFINISMSVVLFSRIDSKKTYIDINEDCNNH